MKKRITLLLFLGLIGYTSSNAQITYSEHIAPIIHNNCTTCHRAGEIGPMPLTNYEEVSAWSGTIQYVTEIKYMPPWQPNMEYSHFVGERGLKDSEIQMIADWVAAGTPQGDASLEPAMPDFPDGSQLGEPDLVLEMSQEYLIEGNNTDDYRVFVLPSGLTEDKEIAAVEFRAGNRRAVHHALMAVDTDGEAAAMDATTPEYGYHAFGDFGIETNGRFTGYTPGIQSVKYPLAVGKVIPAGADVLIQVHYAPLPTDEVDKSRVNIFFKKPTDRISRPIKSLSVTPYDLVAGVNTFFILGGQEKTFYGIKEVPEDISLMSVYPHCHYLGKNWEIYAITPKGEQINIIKIDDWDFNWQGSYTFKKLKKIPKGSIVHIYATYDNTENNVYNPNHPPKFVSWGEATTDEMYLAGMNYLSYREGDENGNIGEDAALTTDLEAAATTPHQLYTPYPNPAESATTLGYYLNQKTVISMEVIDRNGRLIKTIINQKLTKAGEHTLELPTKNLSAGAYQIQLRGEGILLSKSLIVVD